MDKRRYAKRAIPALPLVAAGVLLGVCWQACAGSYQADWMAGTNAANTNYFLGKTGIGTNNPAKQLHVLGDSRLQGGLTVDGAFQVPKQGDVGMGMFTNGVSDQGIVSFDAAAVLTSNVTYSVTNGSSTATIQDIIDAIPKDLNGYSATVVFSNGTYNLSSPLSVDSFVAGTITFRGGTNTENTHTNQTVILNGGTSAWTDFYVYDCAGTVFLNDLALTVNCASDQIMASEES